MSTKSMPFIHLTLTLKFKCQQYKKFAIVILILITARDQEQSALHNFLAGN